MDLTAEAVTWVVMAVVMTSLYVVGAATGSAEGFGVSALRNLSAAGWVAGSALVLVAAAAAGSVGRRLRLDHRAAAPLAAALAFPIFFLLRSNSLNPDGNGFTPKFEMDVPRLGAHVTHDEMLELLVHSRFWFYTHRWWDWTVVFSYQVLSCAAGAVFVFALLRLARRLTPEAPALFLAGLLGGGYMQLFFGDVENYTITTALVALYLLSAWRFLADETPLWVPAGVLGVAISFHLVAAWLGPTLLYLCLVSRQRMGSARTAWRSAALAAAIPLATAVYLQFHGLPLVRFFSSHAGHALQPGRGMFAPGMPAAYWLDQLNLVVLLCPAVLMLIPLWYWRRIPLDQSSRFLATAAVSTLICHALWKSQIGVYNDWNLYAIDGLMLSVLIWRSTALAARTTMMRAAALVLAAAGWLHTYTWIVANHAGGR